MLLAILVSLVTYLALRLMLGKETVSESPLLLIIESLMLLAFGISWLVKGETLFRDRGTVTLSRRR